MESQPRRDPTWELTVSGLRHDEWRAQYGGTVADLAGRIGIKCQRPDVEYSDSVPGGPDTVLQPDAGDTFAVFRIGQAALSGFNPRAKITLWPEHFDWAIRSDGVNYGLSPGDGYSDTPYAYVGPEAHEDDPFWNAPFGATMPVATDSDPQKVVSFFDQGFRLSQ